MPLIALKKAIKDLYDHADHLVVNKISLDAPASSVLDYKANLDHQRRRSYLTSLKRVKTYLGGIADPTVSGLSQKLSETDPGDVVSVKAVAEKLAERLPELKQASSLKLMAPSSIPPEIRSDVLADISEISRCFEAECYRSAVILCGRVLEVGLHRKYYEATGHDALEKSPGIGLGNLIAKLKDKGVELDPAITQQVHLINQVRVFSVHKKQQAFCPSKEQAHAIILYTSDILKKFF